MCSHEPMSIKGFSWDANDVDPPILNLPDNAPGAQGWGRSRNQVPPLHRPNQYYGEYYSHPPGPGVNGPSTPSVPMSIASMPREQSSAGNPLSLASTAESASTGSFDERFPEPHVEHDSPTAASLVNFEYFVSYDLYTFHSYEAAMAGAISLVHPLENLSKKEWALGTYVGEYLKETGGDVPGIAYGWSEEEIEYAKRTMPELRAFMWNVRKWGKEKTVERFARDCYRYGTGERQFESGIMVEDAYTRWYDEGNNLLSIE